MSTPSSWGDAFATIAGHLNGLGTPDEAVFYTSGKTSNEAAFVYQLFVRAFGTNNLPDCSNMCHESSGSGAERDDRHREGIRQPRRHPPGQAHRGGRTEPWHQPPTHALRARGGEVQRGPHHLDQPARGSRAGPVQESPARQGPGRREALADLHLPIRLNGDLALFQAIGSLLVEWDALDRGFLAEYTTGFTDYAHHVSHLDWDKVEASTGLSHEQITAAARMFAESPATITCWAMGITQHHNAVRTIKEIVNVALLRGDMGKPGAGLCPAYYPEANALVPLDSTAEASNQPVYKSLVVRLERPGASAGAQGEGSKSQVAGSPRTDEPHHLA